MSTSNSKQKPGHGLIALITGANKGIGLETARQLGALGYTVLLGARDLAKGEQAAAALRAQGLDAHGLVLDVNQSASIARAVGQVAERFGRVDALVNNAGVYDDAGVSVAAPGIASWRSTFDTNVLGLVETTQAFLPLVKKSKAGRIVNVTSILGSLAFASDPSSPTGGWSGKGAAYAASKSAVNMFTVHLARELADTPVLVNAAHPGWVKTELGGANAPLEVDAGARTSVALATLEDGSRQTGTYSHDGNAIPW